MNKTIRIYFIVMFSLILLVNMIPIDTLSQKYVGHNELILTNYERDRMLDTVHTDDKYQDLTDFYSDQIISDNKFKEYSENSEPIESGDGLMDSAWPMKCQNQRHTSQSPYSTEESPYTEIWRFKSEKDNGAIESSPIVDSDGIVYIGTMGSDHKLYAIYPNGTLKWSYETGALIWSTPALAEDGTIYITSYDANLHALYSSNGTLKWKVSSGGPISSSPVIANDGTIYFGIMGPGDFGRICAVYPNGTIKWHYDTDYWITSDPAIGEDGTVYIGSGDSGMYAIYPNGTLRWRFDTGDIIKGHPSVAEDGTIYISSYDDNLYAIYPNGTMKWKTNTDCGATGSAAISSDGTIYIGTTDFYAIYPNNGTIKWIFDLSSDSRIVGHTSPAISVNGIIYISVEIYDREGGEIIAIDSNGKENWRYLLSNHNAQSSPIIDGEGNIYVGSSWETESGSGYGCLHKLGKGQKKRIDIINPEIGYLYIFGKKIIPTIFNNTIIIGDFNFKVKVYSENELINGVNFYIDDHFVFLDNDPPFEWIIEKKVNNKLLSKHRIEVEAYFQGGCYWFEELSFWFIHL